MFILKENSTGNILMAGSKKFDCQYFAKYRTALQELDLNKRKHILHLSPQKAWKQILENDYTIYQVDYYKNDCIYHYDTNKFIDVKGIDINANEKEGE